MNCASNETLLAMMEKYLDEGRGSTLEQLMLKPLISSIRHKVILEEEVKQIRKERDEAMKKLNSPPIFDPKDPDQYITSVMKWLHGEGCAVVIWTKEELRGVDVDDIECGMIGWGIEAINMNATEEETP